MPLNQLEVIISDLQDLAERLQRVEKIIGEIIGSKPRDRDEGTE